MNTLSILHTIPLRPLNRSGNQRFGPWTRATVKKVFGRLQVTRHEDSRHNRQYTFAALIHDEAPSSILASIVISTTAMPSPVTAPDLLSSQFAYVSISRASHHATLFTDDIAKLRPQRGADVSKTSALEINQASSIARGIGIGL